MIARADRIGETGVLADLDEMAAFCDRQEIVNQKEVVVIDWFFG